MTTDKKELLNACKEADWQQIVLNGGPPCFHVDEKDGRFCFRAQRWPGHNSSHKFLSLEDFITRVSPKQELVPLDEEKLIIEFEKFLKPYTSSWQIKDDYALNAEHFRSWIKSICSRFGKPAEVSWPEKRDLKAVKDNYGYLQYDKGYNHARQDCIDAHAESLKGEKG